MIDLLHFLPKSFISLFFKLVLWSVIISWGGRTNRWCPYEIIWYEQRVLCGNIGNWCCLITDTWKLCLHVNSEARHIPPTLPPLQIVPWEFATIGAWNYHYTAFLSQFSSSNSGVGTVASRFSEGERRSMIMTEKRTWGICSLTSLQVVRRTCFMI